ncbi:MAG: EAL domain-containing response regulator [Gammaproteobacteria bacterium]
MQIADLRFLVAEDHDFQRSVLVRMLENLGAKDVAEAADGQAALDILRDPTRRIDIVISDLEMPGMDGMEFIRHLGEARVPISIILASALERSLVASVETMTTAYGINLLGAIEKPATPQKLEALIKSYKPPQTKLDRPKAAGPTFTLEEIAQGLRNNEFEPYCQPKVELVTGQVDGVEALARWRHPQKGIVAPYAFIKLLEDNGLIDELMWIMLRKAAAFCSTWRAAGLDATASVNLSLKSLTDVQLADRVTELVLSQNLEPRHIVLEVTESAATTDVAKALENLTRLRMRGFGLSIDDYGTGYSSMQQLTRIPFTELKIDRSFVTNAAKQESGRVILESSLDMAKKLKITAVAEGVETREDWDLLRQLGCDLAQGYFIAKPMEADVYLDWARDWTLQK